MGFFKDVDESSGEDIITETEGSVGDALSIFDEVDEQSDDYKDIDVEALAALDSVDDSEIEAMLAADPVLEEAIDIEVTQNYSDEDVMVNTIDEPVVTEVEHTESVISEPVIADTGVDMKADAAEEKEVTVITKGTTIKGGISSDCSLEVMGVIAGDVECQGKLSIFGTVSGNAEASEIFVNTPVKLVGDLKSTGCIKVSEDSIVIGTITGASAFIAGAIKGDIDIEGPVVVDSSAKVLGNITAKSLQLNNGAIVEGICTVGSRESDINSIFE